MQLVYRGIFYQSISTHLAAIKVFNGKYRGSAQIRNYKAKNAVIKDIYVLKYRGIDYIKILN